MTADAERNWQVLLDTFPETVRLDLLKELRALDSEANEELMRLLKAIGILTAIQSGIPERISVVMEHQRRSAGETELGQGSIERVKGAVRSALTIPSFEELRSLLEGIQRETSAMQTRLGVMTDVSHSAAGLKAQAEGFRRRSAFAGLATAVLVGGFLGGGSWWWFRREAALTIDREAGSFGEMAGELALRGTSARVYRGPAPDTQEPQTAIILDGGIQRTFVDGDGKFIIILK